MKRKNVQTNMISFVRHGDGILKIVKPLLHKIFVQKPVGMFGEQEYHICLHVFPLYKTFIIDL